MFPEWTITVINDEDWSVRTAFEQWMSSMNSHVSNLREQAYLSPEAYQADGYITQYGKRGDMLRQYKFVGLFPTDISPIDMDWGNNDQIEEFSVTFAYQWWEEPNSTEYLGGFQYET